jgi:hypothetical protein
MKRFILASLVCIVCTGPTLAVPPMAAKHLYEGKLAEGEKALLRHLEANPDDQARFGLGAIQFLRSFEKLGTGLFKYGLRTHTFFPGMPRELQKLMPENDKPEKITHAAFRGMIQEFVDSLDQATKTLGAIKDDKVKMPLEVAKIKLDLWGRGAPISAAMLFRQFELKEEAKATEKLEVGFDRGDAAWLKGYCHLLAGLGEVVLSLDTREAFDASAHRFFMKADTPHEFLLEDYKDIDFRLLGPTDFPLIADAVQFVYHLFDMPIGEPARLKKALAHFEATVSEAEAMWKYIMAETDDDNEWIPNPRQTGVLKIAVTDDMVKAWREVVLVEAKAILEGKKLVPFWRGKPGVRGVNLRQVFLNPPKRLDIPRWVQGTAAAPYLEKGPITTLASDREMGNLARLFGGANFFGFALWFN